MVLKARNGLIIQGSLCDISIHRVNLQITLCIEIMINLPFIIFQELIFLYPP